MSARLETQITKWMKAANITGFILSAISMIFTAKLLYQFGNTGGERFLYAVFGASIQIAQTVFYVYGSYLLWRGEGGKALPAFGMFCFLFCLSLCGTIGFFAVGNKTQGQEAVNSDYQFQDIQQRLKIIDAQIAESQQNIEVFREKNWITRGVKPEQRKIDALAKERAEISKELTGFQAAPPTDALYVMLNDFFEIGDIERTKFYMFVCYSVALDLSSVILLAYSLGILSLRTETRQQQPDNTVYAKHNTAPATGFQMGAETAFHQNSETGAAMPVRTGTGTVRTEKSPIGFVPPGSQPRPKATPGNHTGKPLVAPEIIRAYITTAWKGEEQPPALMGRRRIGDVLKINSDTQDYIHGLLKKKKVVKVEGKRTIPLMNVSEALARVA